MLDGLAIAQKVVLNQGVSQSYVVCVVVAQDAFYTKNKLKIYQRFISQRFVNEVLYL